MQTETPYCQSKNTTDLKSSVKTSDKTAYNKYKLYLSITRTCLLLSIFTAMQHDLSECLSRNHCLLVQWQGIGLAINRSWVQFPGEQSCVTTLGKLFSHVCLCHQAVFLGNGRRLVILRPGM